MARAACKKVVKAAAVEELPKTTQGKKVAPVPASAPPQKEKKRKK